MGSASETGKLTARGLAALLARLHLGRFSGRLSLTSGQHEQSFLFQEGQPVYAQSNRVSGGLGKQLVESGQISEADRARVAEHVERKKCKEGTALLALQLIEPTALMEAMRDQVHANLVDCFAWESVDFSLDPGDAPPTGTPMLRPELYKVLLEGIASFWTPDEILADLAPRLQSFPRANALLDPIRSQIGSDESALVYLHALDGTKPLWEVLKKNSTPRALATAWVVNAMAAVDYSNEPSAGADADENEAAPEIEIVVEKTKADRAKAARTKAAPETSKKPAESAEARVASKKLENKIRNQFAKLSELDYYELLGVKPNAQIREIKRAYLVAAKTFHPDALARSGVSEEVREHASKVFAEIGKAHTELSDPALRREYDAAQKSGDDGLDANKLAGAELLYRKGEILLRSGNFKGAVEFLRPAVEAWPEESEYQGALGWALFKMHPPELEAAQEHLERAVELAPHDAEQWHRLSLLVRATGDTELADQVLARATALDPSIA
jgi:tetratricopeptide (TPR) repeat protein